MYFIKRASPLFSKQDLKSRISSDNTSTRYSQSEWTQKRYQNLNSEGHEEFVLQVADAMSKNKKFGIQKVSDNVSDIYIGDKEEFVRIITNTERLYSSDLISFDAAFKESQSKTAALITPAVFDPYYYMVFNEETTLFIGEAFNGLIELYRITVL